MQQQTGDIELPVPASSSQTRIGQSFEFLESEVRLLRNQVSAVDVRWDDTMEDLKRKLIEENIQDSDVDEIRLIFADKQLEDAGSLRHYGVIITALSTWFIVPFHGLAGWSGYPVLPDLRPEVLGVAEAVPGRLLHLRVRTEGLVVNLVNVYAPTSGPERLQFYQQASAYLGTLDSHECLVLGGDFNTTFEERDRLGTEQSLAAADTLREIAEHHSLVDIWRDHHPDDTSTFTFVRVEAHRSSHSRLDRIYLSRFHLSRVRSSSIRLAPFSDNHLATMTASLCAERPEPAYWHFNNSLLEDEGFMASFREFWLAWRGQRRAFPSAL
ncbi:unnamed protein product [Caretta caretta]